MYDVIIIGAGPAGISAGLYTARANIKTLILYHDKSSLEKTEKIENYYGFPNGISGKDLYTAGIEQARNLGIEVLDEEVINIEQNFENLEKQEFKVTTNINEYIAKNIILATGNKKNKPKIKGIEKFEGKGISYCAVCDGFFYRNRSVAVLGNGNYAVSEVNELINIAKDVTILTDGKEAPEVRAENVNIQEKPIEEIEGTDKIEQIKFKDGSTLKTDGLFIAQGVAGSNDFAKKLGIITNNESIVVNDNMETNIKGIYASGDCTGGIYQIAKAVHEGMKAGKGIRDVPKFPPSREKGTDLK